ncbi:MAG: DUF502 domain-containing protein [Xanthomonadales bacterium]|jgi:uncharacterized membrane protein|nr:DUF502 domain-containing protein [Xanthomonadales bacterium]MDH3924367.1 DUF502 domain-containing protein [Xanthomonadales bacterium]MDH3941895.1 DUF502 domain-containing protein [Xanthomonadales bacterium]MDH4002431.1 DUF502 domain-containing protein [Xanthomonadales bacterium]
MNTLGKLFLQGLAVVIPAALTGAILWWFARGAEQILGGLLKSFLPAGWYIPGMGVVSGIAMTILVGLLTHVILFQKLFALGDSILNRLPLVKTIYSALQDFIDYLRPDSKVAMSKVVLVKVPGQQFEQLGFVTREDFSSLPLTLTVEEPIAVYLPMSYQIGGYTLFLPRSCLTPVDLTFEEGMKLVLTGAVSREPAPKPERPDKTDALPDEENRP